MPTDYEYWLEQVKTALTTAGVSASARWIAHRLDMPASTARVRLQNMMAGLEPRAPFVVTLNVWMAEGCPVVESTYNGKAGGDARAKKLSPKRRKAIARKARAARDVL